MNSKKLIASLLLFIIYAVSISTKAAEEQSNVSGLRISGFHSGLVQFDGHQRPYISKIGNVFPYKPNGTCIADHRPVACVWRGFEFDYKSKEDITIFDCVAKFNKAHTYTTPNKLISKGSRVDHWRFAIQGRSGHYVRPEYSYNVSGSPLHMAYSCTHNGLPALKWEVTLIPQHNIQH